MKRPGATNILVINAGSSSIKFALYDGDLNAILSGQASGIGGAGRMRVAGVTSDQSLPDHRAALAAILGELNTHAISLNDLSAAAHRVVHGGADLTEPQQITPQTIAQIRACIPLAPLHNPHNLLAVEELAKLVPDLKQFASFDTAFHVTNPDVATRYAIPVELHESNIRRFGFHGISYQSLVGALPGLTGAPLPEKLLAFHLGNGASICAIRNGQSVATTMGYSPLEGLTMGTRSGSIDAGAVLVMAEKSGIAQMQDTLNNRSGLLALSGGTSDMAALLARDDEAAKFAVEHFCYWAARHAGSMIAAMGGVDAMAFTGGIGENAAPVRDRIAELLAWTGVNRANIHVVPAQEERQIAKNALRGVR